MPLDVDRRQAEKLNTEHSTAGNSIGWMLLLTKSKWGTLPCKVTPNMTKYG